MYFLHMAGTYVRTSLRKMDGTYIFEKKMGFWRRFPWKGKRSDVDYFIRQTRAVEWLGQEAALGVAALGVLYSSTSRT
jgi:hypothetical protein